eukprot:GEMP01054708.1.p1 GENE.GEMP01054708.1~~GEMP01054708.1.p1  ORF type:complete len:142 (+),score=46.29 GEMP01054708.1:138-563(+)
MLGDAFAAPASFSMSTAAFDHHEVPTTSGRHRAWTDAHNAAFLAKKACDQDAVIPTEGAQQALEWARKRGVGGPESGLRKYGKWGRNCGCIAGSVIGILAGGYIDRKCTAKKGKQSEDHAASTARESSSETKSADNDTSDN